MAVVSGVLDTEEQLLAERKDVLDITGTFTLLSGSTPAEITIEYSLLYKK